jgi:hypothetical protein
MNARFSHANCSHANTKVARNKCRRDLAKARNIIIAAADALINGPKMLTAAPAVSTDTIIETITIAEEITRENWREFKNSPVVVLTNDDEPTIRGSVTGWSPKLVQIKSDAGKTVRIPSENVVTIVTDRA